MGYKWVKVQAWVDEGERPDQGLPPLTPGAPGYPDNSLPINPRPDNGLPPFIWTGPIYPPVYPPDPGHGPGGPNRPDNSLPQNPGPDNSLPQNPGVDNTLPPTEDGEPVFQGYDIEDEPADPPEGGAGQYVVVVVNGAAKWAWIESDGEEIVEPDEDGPVTLPEP